MTDGAGQPDLSIRAATRYLLPGACDEPSARLRISLPPTAQRRRHDAIRFELRRSSRPGPASGRLTPRPEPVHHDVIERFRVLDIGEMPGGGNLFITTVGDE